MTNLSLFSFLKSFKNTYPEMHRLSLVEINLLSILYIVIEPLKNEIIFLQLMIVFIIIY